MLKQDRVDRKKQVNLARFEEILLFLQWQVFLLEL